MLGRFKPWTWVLAVLMLAVSAPAAAAANGPTITLAPACHLAAAPYGFYLSLSGFPANAPVQAVVRYDEQNQLASYTTDSSGALARVAFASASPFGRIFVSVTITGTTQTYFASLVDPCDPPPPFPVAMCGDGQYRLYQFSSLAACETYATLLELGQAVPTLALTPQCSSTTLVGVTSLALGLTPGATYSGTVTSDSGTMPVSFVADRFGAIGPDSLSVGATSQVTLSLAGSGVNLTQTLPAASCG
jgi:hypothetical protein